MNSYWWSDNWPGAVSVLVGAGLIALLVGVMVGQSHQRAREVAAVESRCASYLHDAQTHADSLYARIGCDQLRASLDAKHAAEDAELMSAAAVGVAAASGHR